MKIAGTARLAAPPDQVWEAFHDPAILARCLPGCESLTETGQHRYDMTVTAGVAAIKGTYDGTVALLEPMKPGSFTMKATGAGSPGTVDADVRVTLLPHPEGGTELTYDADAAVGGMIGGVGQRMLTGVTRKMAGQFFTAVDLDLAGALPAAAGMPPVPGAPPPIGAPPAVEAPPVGGAPAPAPSTGGVGTVYAGRPAYPSAAGTRVKDFALGVATGGLVAIAGVIVGAVIGGR
jgi:carbon monoxide dehydrogenase subunit G